MATISKKLFLSHFRGEQLAHVVRFKKGKQTRSGQALTFYFRPLISQVAEVPLDDLELPITVRTKSKEFQDVIISGIVTYRVADPNLIVNRLNFALNLETGEWDENPLEKIDSLLTQVSQAAVTDWVSITELETVLETGVNSIKNLALTALQQETAVSSLGLEIVSVRIADIKPSAAIEKALQTPTLEQLQMKADTATYDRRTETVKKERLITEQEQSNALEQAKKQELLITQNAVNQMRDQEAAVARQRLSQEAAAEATIMNAEASARAQGIATQAEVDHLSSIGEVKAENEKALLSAQASVNKEVLYARALEAVAKNLQSIGSLQLGGESVNKLINEIDAQAS